MKKRILPALLALCMVMSLLPVAFAEDITCSDDQCKQNGSTHAADAHTYDCTCDGSDCAGDHDQHQATYTAASKGAGLCAGCTASQGGQPEGPGGDDGDGEEEPAECTSDENCEAPAGTHAAECPKYTACGVNGCELDKGHEADHAFAEGKDVCLGYAADERCSATNHIAGCPKYACVGCDHAQAEIEYNEVTIEAFPGDPEDCTSKAGCAFCSSWNSYVTGANNTLKAEYTRLVNEAATPEEKEAVDAPSYLTACTCADCRPNPAMGVVTDENGNAVDPTDPTEPTDPAEPEAPKAEDFTDMEDWMAADVQVALDKGWLEGNGDGTFNGRGVTKGTTIAAALARMAGETITGADWDKDALAWVEDQDVFEGIDLTGESMARKDLVLVIWRMAGKPAAEKELDFTDVDGLEGDHLTAMQWAVENGIVKGNGDGTVTPDGSVNRAALCTMLARYDSLEK